MYVTAFLTVVALLLLAWDASGKHRRPLVPLLSLVLFGTAILLHLFSGRHLLLSVTALSAEVGIGLLLAAGLSAARKATARPFLALGLLALGLAGLFYGGTRLLGLQPAGTETSFLLELGPDDRIEEVMPVLERFGARYERAFPGLSPDTDEDLAQVFLIYVEARALPELMTALRGDEENVDHVEENRWIRLTPPEAAGAPAASARTVLENDPLVARQWALDAIRAHEAHALLRDRTPVRKARIAIVDTGVDGNHEDVQAAFHRSPAARDAHGHGTHCAGLAGAVTNNGVGIASLNWEGRFVEVAGYQALNAAGMGTLEMIAQAIIDAARDGADVISLSLGDRAPTPPKVIVDAIAYARRRGAVVVASAGNANEDARYHMPSNVEGVITVAAVDENLRKAPFSNTNTSLKRPLAAPGVNILSLKPNDAYVALSGTSMATPLVAGLAGVLRALDPDLTAEDLYTLLHDTGTVVEDTERVGRLINAEAALRAVLAEPVAANRPF
ncbi:S8 family serine peptidase [Rhodocaloribacter litoris]|uniref:S8 family serine peptidase n=1 Tax=Rhodocaloribacter litoris TaxID=2558931 RepID=UPI0014234A6C|nr:S8 family serine peptidase [Rhodocaloribacter litoris]QXD14505.1 S8 family serine peptidase [Rhodocaloribacter litoris]